MILPGATLGLLGGGQLGRMFTIRAREMGYRVTVLDPDPGSPAGQVSDRHLQAPYADPAALDELARTCSVVTTEFENVPAEALAALAARVTVRPPVHAVAIAQDRIAEKSFLRDRGFPTAPFRAVTGAEDLPGALAAVGTPALLKTSRLGYDGKGQAAVGGLADLEHGFARFGAVPCVLERRLELEAELSVVLARGQDGELRPFPVAENIHRDGILETTVVPATVPAPLAAEALALAGRVAAALEYVGVLAVEMFVSGGALSVNELAPRPHNSGHWTLDACATDQFEQQLRTACGLLLGAADLLSPVAMVNLLGDLWAGGEPRWEELFRRPGVKLHLYGKSEARPGRKMGHCNVLAPTPELARQRALETRDALAR